MFSSVSFGGSAVCGTCLPNGCAVATHSLGNWTRSAEGDPSNSFFYGSSIADMSIYNNGYFTARHTPKVNNVRNNGPAMMKAAERAAQEGKLPL